jgi:hypothetical protein
MNNKLFSDLKTDEEKSAFFLSGRGYETGVIAPAIQNDVAMAYHRCSEYAKERATTIQVSRSEYEALQKEVELWRGRCEFMATNYFRVASLDMGGRHTYTGLGRTVGRGYSFYEALDEKKAEADAAINMLANGEGGE